MIKVIYESVDGYRKTETFPDKEKALAHAKKWVGKYYDLGSFYAVSGDGIGRVMVEGISIHELFREEATA